ncbi:oligosaccharide flippase family protein [Rahnella aquatilis]|uniref:oligosaccharide flippase family protein n=1 Tax=Rahnella aquatilis TaxID=34038 RepID=UPI0006454BC8|nr:oligosaccharide flippase family protein [Rahnella aquatilis]
MHSLDKGEDSVVDREIRNVIKNAMYLSFTQGITYIAPIIVLAYLIKTLGVDGFGKYAISLAVVAYLQVIVDYGFSFSSSREISQHRNDKKVVSGVYLATTIIKIIACTIIYPIFTVILTILVKDKSLYTAIQCGYFIVIGNAIFPIWFYQGIEKLKIVAILNLVARVFSCVFVFIFVKTPDDLPIAILAQALPVIICALLANLNIWHKKYIFWEVPEKKIFLKSIYNGWDIFVATLSSVILSNSGVFILGVLMTPSVVGVYAAAERIIKAIVGLFAPITQSVYPFNCKKFGISIAEGKKSVNKTGAPIIIFAFLVMSILFLCSDFLVEMLKLPRESISIFKILSLWLFFGVFNNILGIQILSASGKSKIYRQCFVGAALITLVLLFACIYYFEALGAAVALTIGEGILFGMLFVSVIRYYQSSNSGVILK